MPGVTPASGVLLQYMQSLETNDPEFRSFFYRPVDIQEDLRCMEYRRRVSLVRQSKKFCKDMERIVGSYMDVSTNPSTCHPSMKFLMNRKARMNGNGGMLGDDTQQNGHQLTDQTFSFYINDLKSSMGYSDRECMLRCKMASLFRLIHLHGWCSSIYNHISLRISRDDNHFLIDPLGMLYSEISAASLVRIDFNGFVLDSGCTNYGIDGKGWPLHSVFHSISPRIRCVIHITTPDSVLVSNVGLLRLGKESICVGPTECFDMEELLGDDALSKKSRQRLLNLLTMGKHYCELQDDEDPNEVPATLVHVVFIRGNGLIAVGSSIEEAWYFASNAMLACRAQMGLSTLSPDQLWLPTASECARMRERFLPPHVIAGQESSRPGSPVSPQGRPTDEWYLGELEFEALMRHMDNTGFRTGHYYRSGQVGQCTRPNSPAPLQAVLSGGSPGINRRHADVQIPPCVVAMGSTYLDNNLDATANGTQSEKSLPYWMSSHNSYRSVRDDLHEGRTRWICEYGDVLNKAPVRILRSPLLSPAAADPAPNRFAPQGENPTEFVDRQKKVKEKYFKDYSSPGPQSDLVEGLTYEELTRLKDMGYAKISDDGSRLISLAAASKAVIDKKFRQSHPWLSGTATEEPTSLVVIGNPFQDVTDEDLRRYHLEVELKNNPQKAMELQPQQQELEQLATKEDEEEMHKLRTEDIDEDNEEELKAICEKQDDSLPTAIEGPILRRGSLKEAPTVAPSASVVRSATTLPSGSRLTALKSETSGADGSYDDTEKEGVDVVEKKRRRRFKSLFSRKKKDRSSK